MSTGNNKLNTVFIYFCKNRKFKNYRAYRHTNRRLGKNQPIIDKLHKKQETVDTFSEPNWTEDFEDFNKFLQTIENMVI